MTPHDEQLFRLLVDRVKDYAIFMIDPTGRVITWNAGAECVKGYRADQILGQSWRIFYPDEDRRSRKPDRLLERARNEGRVEDEGWRVRKDGSRFWADVIITAIRTDDHELIGFAKITRDLTERRASGLAVQQLNETLEAQSGSGPRNCKRSLLNLIGLRHASVNGSRRSFMTVWAKPWH